MTVLNNLSIIAGLALPILAVLFLVPFIGFRVWRNKLRGMWGIGNPEAARAAEAQRDRWAVPGEKVMQGAIILAGVSVALFIITRIIISYI